MEEESTLHMLLRCLNPSMKAIYISRHNWVVHAIVKVNKRGSKGGCELRWDKGPGGGETISVDMLKGGFHVSLDEEGRECTPNKPDIVMIEKKRPGGRGKWGIRIAEVTHGWDPIGRRRYN